MHFLPWSGYLSRTRVIRLTDIVVPTQHSGEAMRLSSYQIRHSRRGAVLAAFTLFGLLGVGTARADDLAQEVKQLMNPSADQHHTWMVEHKQGWVTEQAVADCRTALAAANKTGIKPTDTVEFYGTKQLWRGVQKMCDELATGLPFVALAEKAGEGIKMAVDPYDDPYWRRNAVAPITAALAELDKAIAAGVPTDVKFTVGNTNNEAVTTIAEARAAALVQIDLGKKAGADIEAKADAETAEIRDRWVKLGAKGDRVKFLMDADNIILLGKNCRSVDGKARIKAPVFYQVNEDDSYWYVWKTVFKKDKLVSTVSRQYNKLTQRWRCW